MAFQIGQSVLHRRPTGVCFDDTIEEWVITKTNKSGSEVWVNNNHKPEDCFYAVYLYPNTPESRTHLEKGIEMSQRHKKEQDEYMVATYQLLNHQTRTGQR